MPYLRVRKNLPLGIAWSWVRFSFVTFREKPVNFLFLALAFMVFLMLPFIGVFLSMFCLTRFYLCVDKTVKNEPFGLSLELTSMFRQPNIIGYAALNMLFELIAVGLLKVVMNYLHIIVTAPQAPVIDQRLMLSFIGIGIFRIIFFGISLPVITFNPEVRISRALLLSWKFILHNLVLVISGVFLLLPFLVVPLYLISLIVLSVTNSVLIVITIIIMLLALLGAISIFNIFAYKLYADGISTEE